VEKKGEGISGYQTEIMLMEVMFGRGAPANGGGGGDHGTHRVAAEQMQAYYDGQAVAPGYS